MDNTVQSLWIGKELNIFGILCIKSFLKLGYEFHLYTYNHLPNIPEGTYIKNANDIINEDQIFEYTGGGVSAFSNMFRYVHACFQTCSCSF